MKLLLLLLLLLNWLITTLYLGFKYLSLSISILNMYQRVSIKCIGLHDCSILEPTICTRHLLVYRIMQWLIKTTYMKSSLPGINISINPSSTSIYLYMKTPPTKVTSHQIPPLTTIPQSVQANISYVNIPLRKSILTPNRLHPEKIFPNRNHRLR